MVSVHTLSPPTAHAACLRCLCDCSKCDISGFDLDSRNSSWSIASLKVYLRKKIGHSRLLVKKAELLERQVPLNRHLAYTLQYVYTPVLFQVLKQTNKKSLVTQTSPALQPLAFAFCHVPIVSGLSIWPRRRRRQTYRFPYL